MAGEGLNFMRSEEHGRARSAGRLDARNGVIRFRGHTAAPFIAARAMRVVWRVTPAHYAVTRVSGARVRPWHARSLPWPPACGDCHCSS